MKRGLTWGALVAAILIASVASAAATAGNGGKKDPVATLQHKVKVLTAQNARLKQYTPAGIARQLATAKAALDKYQSVDKAKADGYQPASPCEFFAGGAGNASSDQGGMGVHFVSQAAMADGKLIPTKPEILVYQPT